MDRKPIRVVISDDHSLFRRGLSSVLQSYPEIDLVGEAQNGEVLLRQVDRLLPDVVLTDIRMPVLDGITATRILLEKHPQVKVLCLSVLAKDESILNMLEAGALGYMCKDIELAEIHEAILTVYDSKPYFCKTITEKLTDIVMRNYQLPVKNDTTFTDRELEIIRFICREYTSKEIAEMLNLSKRTVEGHRTRIMDKIGAKSIAGIITYAVEHGIYQREQHGML